MRLSHPLLLASLGVLVAAASCTLITDVDRSKIPDGTAGMPSGGDGTSHAQAGTVNMPSGGTTPIGGASDTPGGMGNTPPLGGAAGTPAVENGGAGGDTGSAGMPGTGGMGGHP